ncbi:hypothetical protein A2U01_0086600, partial [Trifolium medium]|nr:hypothetical protein [Trifolium medium]
MFFNFSAKKKVLAATLVYYVIKTWLIDRKLIAVPCCKRDFEISTTTTSMDGHFNAMTA